jgi:hypothetical protein
MLETCDRSDSGLTALPAPVVPATQAPPSLVYHSRFTRWEQRASVRSKPTRLFKEGDAAGKLFFPPELVPVTRHPLVQQLGPEALGRILLQRLHLYLDFTAELEQLAVNPISQLISRRKLGFAFPDEMVRDAYNICTDESWHAQFSADLQEQLVEATGVQAPLPPEPRFMTRLRHVRQTAPAEIRGLPELFFTIVSETLISGILSGIPHDHRVVRPVRELVADHAEDEGRHHAYFSQVMECVWPQLSRRQRQLVGPLLPVFIEAFLEPDCGALAAMLRGCGLSGEEVQGVIEEAHPPGEVRATIRQGARSTLRLFRQNGVLDDPATRDAFDARSLLEGQPDSVRGC